MTRIAYLGLALLAFYGIVSWAHSRFDGDGRPPAKPAPEVNVSRLYADLVLSGAAGRQRAEAALVGGGARAKKVSDILPRADENWRKVVEARLRGEEPSIRVAPSRPGIAEPRGLVAPGRPVLHLCEIEGPVDVTVDRIASTPESRSARVVGGARFPKELALQAGERYRIRVETPDGAKMESLVQVLTQAETARFRSQLAVLQQTIPEVELRQIAQGFLALSGGLHDAAAAYLLAQGAKSSDGRFLRGLAERQLFLSERRGEFERRDALTRGLIAEE